MVLVLEILLAAAIVFAVGAVVAGRLDRLAPAPPDRADDGLPEGPLAPEDVGRARFGTAVRGYRMAEVDTVLARLAAEIAARDAEIERLRATSAERAVDG